MNPPPYENPDDNDPIPEETPDEEAPQKSGSAVSLSSDQKLLQITLLHSNESFYLITAAGSPLERDVYIVVDSQHGKDLAVVNGEVFSLKTVPEKALLPLIRPASEHDIQLYEHNQEKEAVAYQKCKALINKNRLEMKLVSAHYLLEEPKILFFFTAENRVDFRELVKDLVSVFKTRIELRQIGIRDESRILGGCSVCGRELCCHSVSDRLRPVSIKMAKEQNLSLNSMKISGPCGRLLCCLSYEYDFYRQEKRLFPAVGTPVFHDEVKYRVTEINIAAHTLRLTGPEDQQLFLPLKNLRYLSRQKKWLIHSLEEDDSFANEPELPEVRTFQNHPTPSPASVPAPTEKAPRQKDFHSHASKRR